MLNMLSCRMCEGEKRKLVIPSELGKRSFQSGYRARVCLGKGEGWFSLCIGLPHPFITVCASPKFSCVQQFQGKALEALSSDSHLCPLSGLCSPLSPITPLLAITEMGRTLVSAWMSAEPLHLTTAHFVFLCVCIFDRVWRTGSSPKDPR